MRERSADAVGDVEALPARAGRPLWAHALAYAALLLALAPLMHLGTSFTSDEGAYALQAEALRDGSWAYDYQAADLDPERRWAPIVNADITADGDVVPYAKHPAYARLVQAGTALLGETAGLYVWSLLAAVVLAAACWLVAAEVAPATERLAFWVAATTPVMVNGFIGWGHAPSAAVAGLATVAAVRIARRGLTVGRAAALVACLAAGVLLRSEGLLFAVALVMVLTAIEWRRRGVLRAAVVAAVTAVPVVVTVALETAWQRAILGPGFTQVKLRGAGTDFVTGRVQGAWRSLLLGSITDDVAALVVLLAVAAAVVAAVALVRGAPAAPRIVTTCMIAAAALFGLRAVMAPEDPVTGLLAACPILVVGLVALVGRRPSGDPALVVVGGTAVVFAGAVLATQYADGGGWHWGGRFLSPATAALVVLAAVGLRRVADRPLQRRLVLAFAVVPAALGLVVVAGVRSSLEPYGDAIERAASSAPVAISTQPHMPRALWSADPAIGWMVAEPEEVPVLLDELADRGVPDVVLIETLAPPTAGLGGRYVVAEDLTEPVVRSRGWQTLRLVLADDPG